MKKTGFSIVLADNQPLIVAGLLSFLSEKEEFQVVNQVKFPEDLQKAVAHHNPDLLILDYNIPGFINVEAVQRVFNEKPDLNILVISADTNKAVIREVLQLGIKGYLTKTCSKEEVLLAIQLTSRGEKFFCHTILDIIMEKHLPPQEEESSILTAREQEILKLLAQGRSTQKIAEDLFLSPHTVQTHRKSIIRKLKIKSPTEFVIHAIDLGMINPK